MISINSAIEVDLTGQVCADSLGPALLLAASAARSTSSAAAARSKGGKPIIALPSTAEDGTISRIVPMLKPGAGVVTSRGDVHYIVTEYGVAYLHGKTMRERALSLVSIAHPKFRPWLLAEAKARHLVYADQIEPEFSTPIYPDRLERWVKLKDGTDVFVRPLRMTDEPALRDMFYSLSEETVYHRFFRHMPTLPHARLQAFMRTDYEHIMVLVATPENAEDQPLLAVARYDLDRRTNMAEVAFVVRDDWQGKGLGTQLFGAITAAAREQGIAGFTATVLADNVGMLRVFHRAGHPIESRLVDGTYDLTIMFEGAPTPVPGNEAAGHRG